MATPNLINATAINGLTAVGSITTTGITVITNSADSGKVQRVNSLLISNVNGTSAATVTVYITRSSVNYRIAYQMSVPAASTLDLVNKTLYINEGDALTITASANSYLEAVVSYEEIS